MQLALFPRWKPFAGPPARKKPASHRRTKHHVERQQYDLFGYADCWSEIYDWPMMKDLSASIGYAALMAGLMRASELAAVLGLPRNWTRDRAIAKSLLESRGQGESIGHLGDRTGCNKKWLREVARDIGLRYRNIRPSDDEVDSAVRLVLRKGMSFRSASSAAMISRSALHRYVSEIRESKASQGEDEGLHVVKAREWRCEIHGRITVYPCVACAAMAARKR